MVDKHCGWSFEPAQTICAFEKSFTYLRTAANPQNTITECNNDQSCIDLQKRFHENGHKIQDCTGSIIPGFAEWQEIDATTGVCLLELEEQNMRVGGWLPVDVWAEKESKDLLTHYVTHRRRWENGGLDHEVAARLRKPKNIYHVFQPCIKCIQYFEYLLWNGFKKKFFFNHRSHHFKQTCQHEIKTYFLNKYMILEQFIAPKLILKRNYQNHIGYSISYSVHTQHC